MKKKEIEKIILKLRFELEIFLNNYFHSSVEVATKTNKENTEIVKKRNTRRMFGRLWKPEINNIIEGIIEGHNIKVKFYILDQLNEYYKSQDLGFQTDQKNMNFAQVISDKIKFLESYCKDEDTSIIRDYIPNDPEKPQTLTAFVLEWVKKEDIPKGITVNENIKRKILQDAKIANVTTQKTTIDTIGKALNRNGYKKYVPSIIDDAKSIPTSKKTTHQ